MKLPLFSMAALALVGGAWLTSSSTVSAPAAVEYSFHEAPLNSHGVKSFSDLRGHPVLIEFWGKN